ncbi:hypothetical protein [Sphaerisporangium album]|uniref:hypothetical protein n=1 Tax=Sphaerisporangium album TaxID=509200 RepID=UPI0015F0D9AD|nr:hypothetical protein [Sphaerisporangium album]
MKFRSRITRSEFRRQAKGAVLQDLRVANAGSECRLCLPERTALQEAQFAE